LLEIFDTFFITNKNKFNKTIGKKLI
jgi:hypothetical protein